MQWYRVLDLDGRAIHRDKGQWKLPEEGQPGEWMPPITGQLSPHGNGYDLYSIADLLDWLGPVIWKTDWRNKPLSRDYLRSGNKLIVREARLLSRVTTWNERTARLLAADCAEHVLPSFESAYPGIHGPREALVISRCYADGNATQTELNIASAKVWSFVGAVELLFGTSGHPPGRNALHPSEGALVATAWAVGSQDEHMNHALASLLGSQATCTPLHWYDWPRLASDWACATRARGSTMASAATDMWRRERDWQTGQLRTYLEPDDEGGERDGDYVRTQSRFPGGAEDGG